MNLADLLNSINPKEVLTNLPDAVLVVENDGKIVWANNKSSILFETDRNNLKGLYLNEIVANGMELAQSSYKKRNAVVTGAVTIDGKEFYAEMNARKYLEQYFITIRDITAMTNVLVNAEKTGRLNKEKNLMLVKLTNEIKSPLQSAIGFSQALLDGLGGEINEKQNKYISIINKNSTDLLYFMDKFLGFSQAESSLFSCDNIPFDITSTVNTVFRLYEKELNSKNITVNFDFEEFNKKTVYSDEGCLKTALQNILDVIIKTTETGTIDIKIDNPDMETLENSGIKIMEDCGESSYVRITITDSGMGFASSELNGIFEPYTKLEKLNKRSFLRSITLGTAYLIIKRMGGVIDLKSQVMKGSVYTIILPIDKDL